MVYFNFQMAICLVSFYLHFLPTRRQHEVAPANALLED